MAISIRLSRGGSKKRPYYRVVVADARSPRDGRFIEKIGTYNPLLAKDSPDRVKVDVERAKHWLSVGAQPTDRVARFLDAIGVKERPARNNPNKGKPGEKATERAEERATKLTEQAEAEAAAAVAAAEAAAAPAPEPEPEPTPEATLEPAPEAEVAIEETPAVEVAAVADEAPVVEEVTTAEEAAVAPEIPAVEEAPAAETATTKDATPTPAEG